MKINNKKLQSNLYISVENYKQNNLFKIDYYNPNQHDPTIRKGMTHKLNITSHKIILQHAEGN